MSVKIYIFNEFKYFDKLIIAIKGETGIYINKSSTKLKAMSKKDSNTFNRNVKIFFNKDNMEKAYKIKEKLEKNGFTFVTDQLSYQSKDKDDNPITILLPKDRIIMEYKEKQIIEFDHGCSC